MHRARVWARGLIVYLLWVFRHPCCLLHNVDGNANEYHGPCIFKRCMRLHHDCTFVLWSLDFDLGHVFWIPRKFHVVAAPCAGREVLDFPLATREGHLLATSDGDEVYSRHCLYYNNRMLQTAEPFYTILNMTEKPNSVHAEYHVRTMCCKKCRLFSQEIFYHEDGTSMWRSMLKSMKLSWISELLQRPRLMERCFIHALNLFETVSNWDTFLCGPCRWYSRGLIQEIQVVEYVTLGNDFEVSAVRTNCS
jgi:hypothetical protein